MELSELKDKILECVPNEDLEDVLLLFDNDTSVFPFNQYELLLNELIKRGVITYNQYIEIRTLYLNANPFLKYFENSSPRGFGEKFAERYVQGKCSKIKNPSKKLDTNYTGDYDLWLDGIKIEVKASRAVDRDSREPLYMKALSRNTDKNFLMNFQQLKPQCCDVFIWVAVYRDQIVLWVMSSKEVLESPFYSKGQHRGNTGNEGQLHIRQDNIDELAAYELQDDNLEKAIRNAAERNR